MRFTFPEVFICSSVLYYNFFNFYLYFSFVSFLFVIVLVVEAKEKNVIFYNSTFIRIVGKFLIIIVYFVNGVGFSDREQKTRDGWARIRSNTDFSLLKYKYFRLELKKIQILFFLNLKIQIRTFLSKSKNANTNTNTGSENANRSGNSLIFHFKATKNKY